jgi:hypothetical protein
VEGAIDLLKPCMAHANAAQLRHVAADPDLNGLPDNPRFQEMLAVATARIADAEEL